MAIQPTSHDDKDLRFPSRHERMQTIAVDFDGVIAEYDGWKGTTVLGSPRKDVVRVLHTLRSEGWKIIIHTTRSALEISEYLVLHSIPYDEINQNSSYQNAGSKPVATIYWDDRALRYSGDAFEDLQQIRSYRTWTGRS